jgi:hypothetical protein
MPKHTAQSDCELHAQAGEGCPSIDQKRLAGATCSAGSSANPPDSQLARLVIDADCTTCGPIASGLSHGISIVRSALRHSAATGHVVILNGTTDLPELDEPLLFD